MIRVRSGAERGRTLLPWLDGRHTFSFGEYRDPRHVHFGALRVINEDVVAPGGGFDTHPHSDMEIVTIVLSGALRHADSMGNGSVIRPGEVQRMSAGTGVTHSEHNDSATDPVHLLQIWLFPERRGLEPSYEQRAFDVAARTGQWVLVASRDGRDDSVTIHQDADLHRAAVPAGGALDMRLAAGRRAWLHVIGGRVRVGDHVLATGDAAAIEDATDIALVAESDADLLLFDLA